MNFIKRNLINPFYFESPEMKNSYFLFNKEVEKKLLVLLQATQTISYFFLTIAGLFFDASLKEILIRTGMIIYSIILYFIGKKWQTIYKIGMLILSGLFMYNIMFFIAKVYMQNNSKSVFLSGNGIGLYEVVLVLSFKNLWLRTFGYVGLFIIKFASFYEDVSANPRISMQFMTCAVEVFCFCVYHDILDRRNFEVIFKAGEKIKKFQDLLSNDLPSSVMIMSSNFESILYSNKFFREKFMLEGEVGSTVKIINDLFGKLILQEEEKGAEIKRFQHHTSLLDCLLEIATHNTEAQRQEQVRTLYAFYKDGQDREIHYEVRLRRIFWDGKHSYAIVMNDITDKQLVTALKIADAQKDRVIATVSHELRTPINGIVGLLEMASELATDKTQASYLENCKNCSKLLLYLVNAILDLSQLRNNSLKIVKSSFSINEMLEEVRSLYIFQSQQKGIQFIIEKDPPINEEIYTDKYRLVEVLINLLGNAMKFTFNGSVKLKISRSEKRNDALCFCVEDTGLGIMEQDKPKLFKMFGKIEQTNKNINTHGAGLGLTIANELVKALNDNQSKDERIMFESEFNKGSKFWFEIDVAQPIEVNYVTTNENLEINMSSKNYDSQDFIEFTEPFQTPNVKLEKLKLQEQFTSESTSFLVLSKDGYDLCTRRNQNEMIGHILLIDDNPLNLMAAAFILEKLKFNVTKAFNGQEGIRILEESVKTKEKFCLVLTDIQMPIMDGLEMSKTIKDKINREEIYSVPIVALTAKTLDEKEHEIYKECRITSSLEKPLVKSEIEQVLTKLIKLEN